MTTLLEQLVVKWRESAQGEFDMGEYGSTQTYNQCADELEAALAAVPAQEAAIEAELKRIGRDYNEPLVDRIRWLVSDYEKRGELLEATNRKLAAVPAQPGCTCAASRVLHEKTCPVAAVPQAVPAQPQFERCSSHGHVFGCERVCYHAVPPAEPAKALAREVAERVRDDDAATDALYEAIQRGPWVKADEAGAALAAVPAQPAPLDAETEKRLREYLWISHGHQGVYGDASQIRMEQWPAPQNSVPDSAVRRDPAITNTNREQPAGEPAPAALPACEHVWGTQMIEMPEGYLKPGVTRCLTCGAIRGPQTAVSTLVVPPAEPAPACVNPDCDLCAWEQREPAAPAPLTWLLCPHCLHRWDAKGHEYDACPRCHGRFSFVQPQAIPALVDAEQPATPEPAGEPAAPAPQPEEEGDDEIDGVVGAISDLIKSEQAEDAEFADAIAQLNAERERADEAESTLLGARCQLAEAQQIIRDHESGVANLNRVIADMQRAVTQSAREIRRLEQKVVERDQQIAALREALEVALTIATANLGTVVMDVNVPRRALRQIRDCLESALASSGPAQEKP